MVTRRIGEDILEDPAESVCVGTEFGFHARGQALRGSGEVFLDTRPGPVRIGAVLEDHINPGVAVVGNASYGLHARQAHHARDERIGDLVFYDAGAAIPTRKHDHLAVSRIRKGVAWQVVRAPDAEHRRRQNHTRDSRSMAARQIDQETNHRSRLSESMRNAPSVTTSSPGAKAGEDLLASAAAPASRNGTRLKTAVASPHKDARLDAAFDHGIGRDRQTFDGSARQT